MNNHDTEIRYVPRRWGEEGTSFEDIFTEKEQRRYRTSPDGEWSEWKDCDWKGIPLNENGIVKGISGEPRGTRNYPGGDFADRLSNMNAKPYPNEDRTGLCTVRDLALMMIDSPRIAGECVSELAFAADGKRINVEVHVTMVDGVRTARQWKPRFNFNIAFRRFLCRVALLFKRG